MTTVLLETIPETGYSGSSSSAAGGDSVHLELETAPYHEGDNAEAAAGAGGKLKVSELASGHKKSNSIESVTTGYVSEHEGS